MYVEVELLGGKVDGLGCKMFDCKFCLDVIEYLIED